MKFSQILDFQKKSLTKAGEGSTTGDFPFYTSSPTLSKYTDSFQFDSPSLIFGTGGGASIHFSEIPFSVSTDCLVAQLNTEHGQNFEIQYVYYYLFGNIHILEKGFRGAGLKHISKNYLSNIEIPELPIAAQKRIVNVLAKLDTLRKKREQAILLLDNYIKSEFIEMFGNVVTNPKGWRSVELNDLCSKIVDCPHSTPKYSSETSDYPCIRSSDLQGGFLDFTATKYVDEKQYIERIQRCKPEGGDIIYCREGARFGQVAYLPNNVRACLGQRTMLLRVNLDVATPEFLWGVMISQGVVHQSMQLVIGAAAPHINVKDIKKYNVFLPPLNLQKKYSQIFNTTLSIKENMLDQSQDLENHFQAFLQKAFKGSL